MTAPSPTATESTRTTPDVGSPVNTDLIHRAAELLRAAADRIAECGLFKGEYWPIVPGGESCDYVPGDPCCALGALAVAADFDDALLADVALDSRPELIVAVDALAQQLDPRPVRTLVSVWNDQPDRTAGQVIAVLHAAAHQLDPNPPGRLGPVEPAPARPGGPSATSFHLDGASSTHPQSTREVTANV